MLHPVGEPTAICRSFRPGRAAGFPFAHNVLGIRRVDLTTECRDVTLNAQFPHYLIRKLLTVSAIYTDRYEQQTLVLGVLPSGPVGPDYSSGAFGNSGYRQLTDHCTCSCGSCVQARRGDRYSKHCGSPACRGQA
jgi:hypothetical protein